MPSTKIEALVQEVKKKLDADVKNKVVVYFSWTGKKKIIHAVSSHSIFVVQLNLTFIS